MTFHLLDAGTYKKGSPPPEGYMQWHQWARQQHNAGLKQIACCHCGKWRFPQELSPEQVTSQVLDSHMNPVTNNWRICLNCKEMKKEQT